MQNREEKKPIHGLVKPSLEREVRILLTDPLTGRIEYGAMSDLLEKLLTAWVNGLKKDKVNE